MDRASLLFGLAALVFGLLLVRTLRRTPGDADDAWARLAASYQQRGLLAQRPDDWDRTYQRSKWVLTGTLLGMALLLAVFIWRLWQL